MADQSVATVAIGLILLGEKRVNTSKETTSGSTDSATPAAAICLPKPPTNEPVVQSTAARTVAMHCADAILRNESAISGEFTLHLF